MYKKRLRRNVFVLLFILLASIIVLLTQWYSEVNKYHDIEDMNAFHWQKHMNKEEFAQLEEGMSYFEVVEVAKGTGEQIAEDVYIWDDELLITQSYEVQFQDGKLEAKKVIEKRGYSTR